VPGLLCTRANDRNWAEKELGIARGKKHSAEQILKLLRQIKVAIANGKTTAHGCKEAEITEQTYYRWRKEFGGLKVDQARRLKEFQPQQAKTACRRPRLEQENAKLKRLVSELSLEKLGVEGHRRAGNF
jgi:putative transposase